MKQPIEDPPRPLLASAATRVALSIDAAAISDFAAALVPTNGDVHSRPGELIVQARQLRKFTAEYVIRAVLLERANGSSWASIAAAFGYDEEYVRATYEPSELAWRAALNDGDANPLRQAETLEEALLIPQREVPTSEADIRKAAELLDDWCTRHAAVHALPSVDQSRRPVTDGIIEQ